MTARRPSQPLPCRARCRLQERYDRLWTAAIGQIRAGNIEQDPVLAANRPDRRRCLTVIARPSPDTRRPIAAFLRQLRKLEPDQHYYAPSELHVTILSMFAPTIDCERLLARTQDYMAAVEAALRKAAPLRIEFSGVTGSRQAILIQGFCDDDALDDARDALRRQLTIRGLGSGLDERYRIETAHMTAVRFRSPLRDSGRFAAALEQARELRFGVTRVRSVSLVRNDWYMTRRITKALACYPLSDRRPHATSATSAKGRQERRC